MKTNSLLYAGLLLVSCNTLRKSEQLKFSEQEQKLWKTDSLEQTRVYLTREIILHDSLQRQVFAVIYPKGTFSFNSSTGFNGEAEKVLLAQQDIQHTAKKYLAQTSTGQDKRIRSSIVATHSTEKSGKMVMIKRKSRLLIFVVIGLVLVLLVGVVVVRIKRALMPKF